MARTIKAGEIIMPYKQGGATLGVYISFPDGTNIRALKKLLIKEFLEQTGRKLSNNEIRRSGVLANMEVYDAKNEAQGCVTNQDAPSSSTEVLMPAVHGELETMADLRVVS